MPTNKSKKEIQEPSQEELEDKFEELTRPEQPVQELPQEFHKSAKSFQHRLYKLEVESLKRNVSWKYLQPNIKEIEHCHFFHSVKKNGTPQDTSTPTGGHYHTVKVFWDRPAVTREVTNPDGTKTLYKGPQFECSPPLKKVIVKRGNRSFQKEAAISYPGVNQDGDEFVIEDTHTHFVTYLGTETISPETERRNMEADRMRVGPTFASGGPAAQPLAEEAVKRGTYKPGQE